MSAVWQAYFTLNGQHIVTIDGDAAAGISYSQLKMVGEHEWQRNIADYSVKYDDKYVHQKGHWLIKGRTGYIIIAETRPLS